MSVKLAKIEASAAIEFAFPLRTKTGLNAREHWAARAKRVERERMATRLELVGLTQRMPRGLKWAASVRDGVRQSGATITLTRISPRAKWSERKQRWAACDDDNLAGALKAVRDEIAAWLGIDDGSDLLTWRYEQARGETGVAVRIEVDRPAPTYRELIEQHRDLAKRCVLGTATSAEAVELREVRKQLDAIELAEAKKHIGAERKEAAR